jgi:hypothetical protein
VEVIDVPKVSVVMPVYNTEKYLRRSLEALVNQTLKDIEIIAINDGSTDSSLSILKEYASQYPNIRVISKENGGQATARNMGIMECNGDYIGFADSDDYVDTTMFEKMYALAVSKNCDMVECYFHYIMENKDGRVTNLKPRGNVREYKDQQDMLINPQVSPWNKLYRREVLHRAGIHFPEGLIYEDTAFYIKTIPYVKKAAYLDEQLVYYFLRGTSTMNSNKSQRVGDIFPVLEDILQFYDNYGFYEEYRCELEYFCVKIALCSSLSRIGRVTDKALEDKLLDQTFEFINKYFPDYKDNKRFASGKVGYYIKIVNRKNSKYIGRILGRVMKG